jgi:G:T-mismatch repair DNA endonuclease (very short patch repair protein)
MEKIHRTQARDQAAWRALTEMGWTVLVLWECEICVDAVAKLIRAIQESPPVALGGKATRAIKGC